jgi:hypothetical protein
MLLYFWQLTLLRFIDLLLRIHDFISCSVFITPSWWIPGCVQKHSTNNRIWLNHHSHFQKPIDSFHSIDGIDIHLNSNGCCLKSSLLLPVQYFTLSPIPFYGTFYLLHLAHCNWFAVAIPKSLWQWQGITFSILYVFF